MKAKLLNMLPYLIVLAVDFYLLPVAAQNTGAAMLLMLCLWWRLLSVWLMDCVGDFLFGLR